MHRVDAVAQGHRQQQRHQHHDGGKDLHQRAGQQQEQGQCQQEDELVRDQCLHRLDRGVRDAGIDQVVGQSKRHAQDQQHAADDLGRFAQRLAQQAPGQLAVRQRLGQHGVERGQRGAFSRRGQAANQRADRDEGRQDFPFGVPGSGQDLAPVARCGGGDLAGRDG